MTLQHLFFTVLIASFIGFGGLSSLPVLRGQLQSVGLPADSLLLHSLAIGNISPGPNGLYLVVVGYFIAGVKGAGVATVALAIPPFLAIVLDRIRNQLLPQARFRAVMTSLSLAVIAVLVPSSVALARNAGTDMLGIAMVVVGIILLLCKIPPLVGIGIALLVGLLIK
jgi:chromate transporter